MDIIDQIILIRTERGITQQKLSEMTGILQPVIARVEMKRSSPTVEFLAKVLKALELELTLQDSFVKIIDRQGHREIVLANPSINDFLDSFLF